MVARRRGGEPLQYVVGRWQFRRLDLLVDGRVLIPRPETETVVDVALAEAARLSPRPASVGEELVAVDLGTGSGAIALSLALELDGSAQVWATDISPAALAVAGANLASTGGRAASRVTFASGSWFDALPGTLRGRISLLVSNPPYVAHGDRLPPELAWEPPEALFAGTTGLEAVDHILAEAPVWMARPGVAVLEIAPHQAAIAVERAREAGFTSVDVRPDLAGRPRALVARLDRPQAP
jgi:release factor glutamine methyltransferase